MVLAAAVLMLPAAGCPKTPPPKIPVDRGSVKAGGQVTFFKGEPHTLAGNPVHVGDSLPSVKLVDSLTGKEKVLAAEEGEVLFMSVVPSIDAAVCMEQTAILGSRGADLPENVRRITISMDPPESQEAYAQDRKLADMEYFSDEEGAFGRATGLLVEDLKFLARAVILVDGRNVIRYMQVVPEIGHLPDMDAALDMAAELAGP
jgi:thiol peroxidase